MTRGRFFSKCLMLLAVSALVVSALVPGVSSRASAGNATTLVVSIPEMWENTLTSDLLAEFEAAHSGVDVVVTLNDTGFFGFGGASSIDDQLDSTEEFVMTADVLYVDPTSLSTEDTQAGYFLDLSPLVMNDASLDTSDYVSSVWQSFQWDNGIWAMPLSTDVILVTYDAAAFDEAGVGYPNERWTVDDFANAAQKLTQYNADGTVATAGMTVNSAGGDNLDLLLRALLGTGLYDSSTLPNAPSLNNPNLEPILQTWYEMQQDGVVAGGGGGGFGNDVPLRIEGTFGYSSRFNRDTETVRYASLLPGGVAGLNVQGFAVSAGTQSPELAYDLAKWLTERSDLANNNFSVAPAHLSLVTTTDQNTNNNQGGPGGGDAPGGGGPGGGFGGSSIPDEVQPVVDQGLYAGLPISELRYTSYLSSVLTEMASNGGDALNALQTVEATALTDSQTAQARYGTVSLYVTPPVTGPVLASGEIALTCAVNSGLGGGRPGGRMFNETEWNQVIDDYVASDPLVGAVTLESVQDTDLAVLAEQYDCIILPSNVVQSADLSVVLNLDPLIDTDTTFDRNDVIGNTLAQLQKDNKTWALPLAIQPQMLEYDPLLLSQAGVSEPVNGWTTDSFVDALHMLKPYDTDPAPFVPNDPSGAYIMMLIGAFGGLPLDYRTDPVTVNFTDPTTVDAIRQVLDLAVDGYMSYSALTDVVDSAVDALTSDTSSIAITTNTLNQFRGGFGGGGGPQPPDGQQQTESSEPVLTPYPQGTQYGVLAYEITTGYISATAQNPDSAYGFLSAVARNPQLFSGMPARGSLVSDPTVAASQGAELVAVYQQLDTLLRSPNTIIFPTYTSGRGGSALDFIQSYWLNRAFDRYVLEGADLDYELTEAQTFTQAYMDCAQSIAVDTAIDVREQQRETLDQIRTCASSVDPDFSLFGN